MAKLIILRGNSGSGKTSVARELQRRFGRSTLLISQDVVRREMLWARDGEGTQALPLLIQLLEYGREHCAVTILEGILNAQWYMPLFQRAVELYGSNIFAFYYDIPFEETLRRHSTKPNHLEFGAEEMRQWWKEKDYIGLIPETILTKEMGFSAVVNQICQTAGLAAEE